VTATDASPLNSSDGFSRLRTLRTLKK